MKFQSTNGNYAVKSFTEAILVGICPDGGLLMPEDLPSIDGTLLDSWKNLNYPSLLMNFLQHIVEKSDPIYEYLKDIETETFKYFGSDIAPFRKLKKFSLLELYQGPTLAFKDYPMFPLAFLIDKAIKIKANTTNNKVIRKQNLLIATSGDTGSSALEASKDFPQTINTFVLLPKDRITKFQRLQMVTSNSPNGFAIECSGTCDDLDEYIQIINKDQMFCDLYNISGLNSVNCGRIICQMALHIYAYLQASETTVDTVNIAIPSGGYGNVTSACLVYTMGVPIKIILCNNENDFGNKLMKQGIIFKDKIPHFTWSNAMDISVPSNFPRLLWIFSNHDTNLIKATMDRIQNYEKVVIPDWIMEKMRSVVIDSISVSNKETIETMKKFYDDENYYICPHTSTAVSYFYQNEVVENQTVVLSTANINKFPDAAKEAGLFDESKLLSLLNTMEQKPKVYTTMESQNDPIMFLKEFIKSKN